MRNIDHKLFDLPKDKKNHIHQTLNDLSNIHLDLFDNPQIAELTDFAKEYVYNSMCIFDACAFCLPFA